MGGRKGGGGYYAFIFLMQSFRIIFFNLNLSRIRPFTCEISIVKNNNK